MEDLNTKNEDINGDSKEVGKVIIGMFFIIPI